VKERERERERVATSDLVVIAFRQCEVRYSP
jgi:hypothetical protein